MFLTWKPCRTPVRRCADQVGSAADDEVDGQREADVLRPARIATFTPTTSPITFRSGPPELPGLIGALVWIRPL